VTITLERRIEALYGLERRKDKLGLEGTQALLRALGDPQARFRSVHVAGTNGKGSVCALIERVLREAGYRTGLYTSPHLVDFRERIRVNGRWADAAWLERTLDRIEGLPEAEDRTFFEVATALGFLYFAEHEVEMAVVEVGLGGRLDCTNVLTPEVCAISSIGLDHTEILGETLAKIAAEKAGIAKPGVPLVVSRAIDPAALEALARVADARGAPWVEAGDPRVGAPGGEPMAPVGMQGAMVHENARVAEAVLAALSGRGFRISEAALRAGFRAARWPGRLEASATEPRLWWDGAHNPQGIESLKSAGAFGAVVLALSRDKDAADIVPRLRAMMPSAALIATRSRNGRAMAPESIAEIAEAIGWEARVEPDLLTALGLGLDRTRSATRAGGDRVLLTGSLFAVGEAMEAFGGAPGEQL
jgi:dihydrofolate synthase / folylpolyglutamate synthase